MDIPALETLQRDGECFRLGARIEGCYWNVLLWGNLDDGSQEIILLYGMFSRHTLDEMSIRVFLFLPIPPLVIVWIVMCSWGSSRCNCRSSGVTFLPLALVGRGWNSRRCWKVGGVGVVLLSDERADKLVIGGEEMES